jgi:hypothetical protein
MKSDLFLSWGEGQEVLWRVCWAGLISLVQSLQNLVLRIPACSIENIRQFYRHDYVDSEMASIPVMIIKRKELPWPLARKRTISTERPPYIGEI